MCLSYSSLIIFAQSSTEACLRPFNFVLYNLFAQKYAALNGVSFWSASKIGEGANRGRFHTTSILDYEIGAPGASICLKVSEGPGPGLFKGIFRTAQSLPTFLSPTLPIPHPFPPPLSLLHLSLSQPSHSSTLPLPIPPYTTPLFLPSLSPFWGRPLNLTKGLGSAVSFPSGSGRSPATKRLVHFKLKRMLLVMAILKSFL